MGIALDPKFADNGWIYLWYSPPIANAKLNRRLRLGRFTMTAQHTLDMKSEKILIDILASKTDQWHSGGPMQFDAYGDLWGSRSAITATIWTPDQLARATSSPRPTALQRRMGLVQYRIACAAGLLPHPSRRFRRRVIPSPRGNFGEYWADQWEKQGKATLAAQYRDTAKVLPEMYVKGERSNFSCAVHPTKRWLAWGTVNYRIHQR